MGRAKRRSRVAGWMRTLSWRLGAARGTDVVGRRGERAAERFLRREGFRVIARNVIVPQGEVDLVCVAPERTVVIVEVKTRRVKADAAREAGPEVNVDEAKRQTLRAIVAHLSRHNGWTAAQVRVDVVAVQIVEDGEDVVRRFEDVLNG